MTEIKFRLRDKNNKILGYEIWNKELSRWQYIFAVGEEMDTTCPLCHYPTGKQSLVFLNKIKHKDQFTGFKDKNGEEIYEGDICLCEICNNWDGEYNQEQVIVKFSDGVFSPVFMQGRSFCDEEERLLRYRNFEVIGNIYENPELLTPTPL